MEPQVYLELPPSRIDGLISTSTEGRRVVGDDMMWSGAASGRGVAFI